MEKGDALLVIYDDASKIQTRRFIFLKLDGNLFKFKAQNTNKIMYITANRIIRMEELDDEKP